MQPINTFNNILFRIFAINYSGLAFFCLLLANVSSFAQSPTFYVMQNHTLFRADFQNCSTNNVIDLNLLPLTFLSGLGGDIAFDTLGNLFFAAPDGNVYRADTITGQMTHEFRFNTTSNYDISGLTIDFQNRFWGLGSQQVYFYDPNTMTHFVYGPFEGYSFGSDLTFISGKLTFPTILNRNPLDLAIVTFDTDTSTTEQIINIRNIDARQYLYGYSSNADSCSVLQTVGAYAGQPFNFLLVDYNPISTTSTCMGSYPNPQGAWGSAFKSEYLASMPSVQIVRDSFELVFTDPCKGIASLTVKAKGGIDTLRYSLGGQDFSFDSVFVLQDTGWYEIYVKDSRSCYWMDSFYFQPPPLKIDSLDYAPYVCSENEVEAIIIFSSGGFGDIMYSVSGSGFTKDSVFTGLLPGSHVITIMDTMGCTLDTLIHIPVLPPPQIALQSTPENCTLRDATVSVDVMDGRPPFSYSINGVDFQTVNDFGGLSSGMTEVFVRDSTGCVFQSETEIQRVVHEVFAWVSDTSCIYDFILQDTLLFTSSDGCDSIVYFTGVPGEMITEYDHRYECGIAITYQDTVLVQILGGCDTLRVVTVLPAPSQEIFQTRDTCSNQTIADRIVIQTNQYGCDSTIVIQYRAFPMYEISENAFHCDPLPPDTIALISSHGCDSLIIRQYDSEWLPSDGVSVLDLTEGTSLQLVPDIDPSEVSSFQWTPDTYMDDPGIWMPYVSPPNETEYVLEAISIRDCPLRRNFRVRVLEDTRVYIPTAISPNADGVNDVFRIYLPENSRMEPVSMQIFDKWGSLVYDCRGNDCAWDGTARNQGVTPGTYVYVIELVTGNGDTLIESGEVVVMR